MDDPIPAWVREKFPKIEHFYRRLPILPEQEKHVEMMMARMIGWCTLTHSRNRKGKKETIRQLDGLAKRSTKLRGLRQSESNSMGGYRRGVAQASGCDSYRVFCSPEEHCAVFRGSQRVCP